MTGVVTESDVKRIDRLSLKPSKETPMNSSQEANQVPSEQTKPIINSEQAQPAAATTQNWTPEQLERAETNRLKALAIQASRAGVSAGSAPAHSRAADGVKTASGSERDGDASNSADKSLPAQKRARVDTEHSSPAAATAQNWTPEQLERAETNRLKALAIQKIQTHPSTASHPSANLGTQEAEVSNAIGSKQQIDNPYRNSNAGTATIASHADSPIMRNDMEFAYYRTDKNTYVSADKFRVRHYQAQPFLVAEDKMAKAEILFQQPGGEGLVVGTALKHINEVHYKQTLQREGLPQDYAEQRPTIDKPTVLVRINPHELVSGSVAKRLAQGADLDSRYGSKDIFIQNRLADGSLGHNFATKDFYERNPPDNRAQLEERFANLGIRFNWAKEPIASIATGALAALSQPQLDERSRASSRSL
jgi:hypothetical protein